MALTSVSPPSANEPAVAARTGEAAEARHSASRENGGERIKL